MKYINEQKIWDLLDSAKKTGYSEINSIIAKAKSLKRLKLEESAALLVAGDNYLEQIFEAASFVKNEIYGRRIVLFAPLYISNICMNNCLYCAFNSNNKLIERKSLSPKEIKEQVIWLLKRGHKRILLVSSEGGSSELSDIDYYTEAIKSVYSVKESANRIKRVNINCAPLSIDNFKKLKKAGIGTYQLFQETYHEITYKEVHPCGPKSDPDNRIDAINRAFLAGIDDFGLGVLYGLYDYRFETLALLMHVESLEKEFDVGPHTISVPRIEYALGSEFSYNHSYRLSDIEFKKLVAVLRLCVPYTGIILSTRETATLRDELFSVGVSQISAESRTSPGGYSGLDNNQDKATQFHIGDQRSLEEIVHALIVKGFIPSFCAACYRKERTGEAFMNLARPGTIKGKCSFNALITLKEYLDDFASSKTKEPGYELIKTISAGFSEEDKKQLSIFFDDIDKGLRDKYV